MPISPRYGERPIITIAGSPRDQLEPLVRQRRRLAAVLAELSPDEWRAPSRCGEWSVRDVAAHLAGVNQFWALSVRAGLDGVPTRFLDGFDPVATPARLVAEMRELTSDAVRERFTSSNDDLLTLLEGLDDAGWAMAAEAPPGHLPVRLLASHALWDAWVHERDIVLPLGRDQPLHPDEVGASLRYVCGLTAAVAILAGAVASGPLGVGALDPDVGFVLTASACIDVVDAVPPPGVPTLRGGAVDLVEALSLRAPFATAVPAAWEPLLGGFAAVFTPHG